MKQTMKNAGLAVTLVSLAALLTAFMLPGGDSYSIYINNEKRVEQYVTREASIPEVTLPSSPGTTRLKAQYSHCGKIGTGRTLSLKVEGTRLKEWAFRDVGKDSDATMEIAVSEVLAASSRPLRGAELVYTSHELPEGRVLAMLQADGSNASLK